MDKFLVNNGLNNIFGRGPGTLTVTTEAAGKTKDRLYDGRSDIVYRALGTTDQTITKDTNLIGTWTENEDGSRQIDIECEAGEHLRIMAILKALGDHDDELACTRVIVQNLMNGHYLVTNDADTLVSTDNAGHSWYLNPATWQSTIGVLAAEYRDEEIAYVTHFQVESIKVCNGWDRVTLRITEIPEAGGDLTLFVNTELVPAVNFVAAYGTNFCAVTPLLQSSDDGATWTTRATLTVNRPGFYGTVSMDVSTPSHLFPDALGLGGISDPAYARYWRFKITGSNLTTPAIAELGAGDARTPIRTQRWGWKEREDWKQLRQENDAGQQRAYIIADCQMRGLDLSFLPFDEEADEDDMLALESIRQEIWQRSRGGAYTCWVVPVLERPHVVFGMISKSPLDVSHILPNAQETGISVDPLPPPVIGP